jgi:LysR family transcriptional regulator, hydrogen peroxide-inducible genes activator
MNLQQLEYVLAVNEQRHFVRAAEKCHVTQPTLSMMIQKLEEELGIKIFDRSKQPITPTPAGEEVIQRARLILGEVTRLREFASEQSDSVEGELKLAVIPTLAPYLVPLFVHLLMEQYPNLDLSIREIPTSRIIELLQTNQVDIGLMATPLSEAGLDEFPLFYEEFLVYASEQHAEEEFISTESIRSDELWLLEEGHCFRNQVINFCNLKKRAFKNKLHYEAGSIETLVNLVDRYRGVTVVPMLATRNFQNDQKQRLKRFAGEPPVREVSLVVNKNYPRTKMLQALKKVIMAVAPLQVSGGKKVVGLD